MIQNPNQRSRAKRNTKNISSGTCSQLIAGKNSESKINWPRKVSQKNLPLGDVLILCVPLHK